MSVIYTWGSTAQERSDDFACDRYVTAPNGSCFRAVDVAAPVQQTFRWLCQLRVAPYSYDWLDNRGRRSPRRRDPQLEKLARGQSVMRIFRLVDFEPDRHITLLCATTKVFGDLAVTYTVRPGPLGSRIVVKLVFRLGDRPVMRWLLPPGDLIMMRKQLLTLKRLAEREHAQAARASAARFEPA